MIPFPVHVYLFLEDDDPVTGVPRRDLNSDEHGPSLEEKTQKSDCFYFSKMETI